MSRASPSPPNTGLQGSRTDWVSAAYGLSGTTRDLPGPVPELKPKRLAKRHTTAPLHDWWSGAPRTLRPSAGSPRGGTAPRAPGISWLHGLRWRHGGLAAARFPGAVPPALTGRLPNARR